MASQHPIAIDPAENPAEIPATSRRVYVIAALIYPFWHLAAPRDATDPWIAWWAVAACFLLVELASLYSGWVEQRIVLLRHLCAWLCTLQLYVLAFVNDMQPFFVIGSAMSVIATSVAIRTRPLHLAWAAFVFVLSAVLFALEPEGLKLAYWGAMFTIIWPAHYRLVAQVNAAETARRQQELLEYAVRERTSELSDANRRLHREMEERARLEEELRVAQRLEAVGRLAGGIAHEFNNLLTRIRLYAEFARIKADSDGELCADIGEIQKAGRQATSLTRQLLTFSRRAEVRNEVLDLDEIIESASPMLRHLLGESIDLLCLPGEGSHCTRADRGQLEQILVNLTLNARDAMSVGGRLTISTAVTHPQDDTARELPDAMREVESVLLAVSDTGIGMDAETRAHAFDPFFSRKRIDQGTGLGLSIVYGIVKQAGGHVRIASEPGKGTRFELFWPRLRERAAPAPRAEAPGDIRGGDERVLLVEDEPELRAALRRVLTDSGYDVLEAKHPGDALQLARETEGPIHLLLTDVVMPVMNGIDLADALCASRPETRVLLVSGHMDLREPLERALPSGVGFIAKPFETDELAAKIREVLDAPAPLPDESAPARGDAS